MTAGEDMERRMHWLRLARELGQEDDFRALLDDVRRAALADPLADDRRVLLALPTAPHMNELEAATGISHDKLYPILAKLEQHGRVASGWEDLDAKPLRRRYWIT